MLFRVIHAINAGYALAIFWVYVAALVVGLCAVFIFPPAPLMLVFLGLLFLGPALIGSKILLSIERLLVRRLVRHGVCPQCHEISPAQDPAASNWRCEHCHAEYLPNGSAVLVDHALTGV